jgi:drug/metabolite transporter (DMT)-like permease
MTGGGTFTHPVSTRRGTLMGLAAILLWSSSVALSRRTAEQVGPLHAGAAVYLSAGFFLLLFRLLARRTHRAAGKPSWRFILGCGSLFVSYMLALYLALGLAHGRLQAIEIGLLNYMWPALTLLFSLLLLNCKASWLLLPGTLCALAGVFLAMTHGMTLSFPMWLASASGNPVAYSLGAFAAVSWALYSSLTRRWGGVNRDWAVALFMVTAGIAFLLLGLGRTPSVVWTTRVVGELALLAVTTALGYMFWDTAMRTGDLVVVASSSYMTPFLSTVFSCLYLGVVPGPRLWLGCALIICGSLASWYAIKPAEQPHSVCRD